MFSSFRRHYLDQALSQTDFRGDVLDIGGKKSGSKGKFRAPISNCTSWKYVNIDPLTEPDLEASAESLPLQGESVDFVLMAETLEHLEFPEKALAEAERVLRKSGKIVLTVPFLFPLHGDPQDFQRWTPEKFRRVLEKLGFREIDVQPMGGLFAALVDTFEGFCQLHYVDKRKLPFVFRVVRKLIRQVFIGSLLRWDSKLPYQHAVTGGYFIVARKPS